MNPEVQRADNLHRHPVGADYVVIRPKVLIGGVHLRNGDHLPVDSPIRQQSRRLELLCRQRVLRPERGMVKPAQAPIPEVVATVAATTATKVDYSVMTVKELRAKCELLSLKTYGNRATLSKRLRQSLATA